MRLRQVTGSLCKPFIGSLLAKLQLYDNAMQGL